MYFGVASNDDARQPDAKDKLKEAFAAAKVPAEIEVYPERSTAGACRTCRTQNGAPIYSKPDAERAWAKLHGPLQSGPRVIFRQFYLNCLAHASYLVGDERDAHRGRRRSAARHRAVPGVRRASTGCESRTCSSRTSTPTSSPAISSCAIAPARAIYLGAAARGGVRVHAARRRRQRRVRRRAAAGARDAGPHAGVDLDPRVTTCGSSDGPAVRGADRRHAVRRRRRPARPARGARLVSAADLGGCSTTRCATSC